MIRYELYFNCVAGLRNLKHWRTLVKTEGATKDIVCAVDLCYQSPLVLLLYIF